MTSNRWVIVTGATGGIGFACCKILLENNYKIIALGRNYSTLKEKFHDCLGENLILKEVNLLDISIIKNLLEEINSQVGKVYGFVHCAGLQIITPINTYKIDKIREMFELNVFSAFEFIKYLSKKK
ncbi:MAG: SDR family NAD(P)-dependent oxidoreductase, partial [Cetobacterium sp.]